MTRTLNTSTALIALSAMAMAAPTEGNPFDFSVTEDLPEAIAKKLSTNAGTVSVSAREWATVVEAGKKAGYSALTIGQIMAAAHRMGITVPGDQTVRNYLNAAVTDGLLVKPTTQTYAVAGKAVKAEDAGLGADDAVAVSEDIVEAPAEDDVLAGIVS